MLQKAAHLTSCRVVLTQSIQLLLGEVTSDHKSIGKIPSYLIFFPQLNCLRAKKGSEFNSVESDDDVRFGVDVANHVYSSILIKLSLCRHYLRCVLSVRQEVSKNCCCFLSELDVKTST